MRWRVMVQWTLLAVSVALLARMVWLGWPEIRQAVVHLVTRQAPLVAAVLALQVVWAWALAQIARSSLRAVGAQVRGRDALRISMAGFTLSRVVPVGGAAGGVFAAREYVLLGHSPPVALAGMVVSWVVATTTLAALIAAGAAGAALLGQVASVALVPSSVILALLVGLAALAVRGLRSAPLRRRLADLAGRVLRRVGVHGVTASWSGSLDAVAANLRAPRRLLPAFAWSAVAWLLDIAALWLVFAAFGHRLGLADIVIGYGFANLLSALPELTPGWIGVFEVALTTTYTGLGAPAGTAVAAVLAYRLVSFWLPVAAGIVPAAVSLGAGRPAGQPDTVPAAAAAAEAREGAAA